MSSSSLSEAQRPGSLTMTLRFEDVGEDADDGSTTAALSPEQLAAAAVDRDLPEGEVPQALDALIESLGTIRARLGAEAVRASMQLGDERFDDALLDLHAAASRGTNAVAETLAKIAISLLGASRALVLPIVGAGVEMQPIATAGAVDEDSGGARQVFRKRLITQALAEGQVVEVELLGHDGQTSKHATLLSLELSAALAGAVCLREPTHQAPAVLYVESTAASGRGMAAGARKVVSKLLVHAGVAWTNSSKVSGQ